jgi:hypothetical protein
MTSKGFVLAACLIALGATTGASYAGNAIHVARSERAERPIWLPQWQTDPLNAYAFMRSGPPEAYTRVYHGGPKYND